MIIDSDSAVVCLLSGSFISDRIAIDMCVIPSPSNSPSNKNVLRTTTITTAARTDERDDTTRIDIRLATRGRVFVRRARAALWCPNRRVCETHQCADDRSR
jgi:hypothetical protein